MLYVIGGGRTNTLKRELQAFQLLEAQTTDFFLPMHKCPLFPQEIFFAERKRTLMSEIVRSAGSIASCLHSPSTSVLLVCTWGEKVNTVICIVGNEPTEQVVAKGKLQQRR